MVLAPRIRLGRCSQSGAVLLGQVWEPYTSRPAVIVILEEPHDRVPLAWLGLFVDVLQTVKANNRLSRLVCRSGTYGSVGVSSPATHKGKTEMGPLAHLARWCGAKVQQSGQGADILLMLGCSTQASDLNSCMTMRKISVTCKCLQGLVLAAAAAQHSPQPGIPTRPSAQ